MAKPLHAQVGGGAQLATAAFAPYTFTLRGKAVTAKIGAMRIKELQYFVKNPRVHSLVHVDGQMPSQEDIETELLKQDHVKKLIQDLRSEGGLVEPLYVLESTREVLEGNSRLAAYRFLAKKSPAKWLSVNCIVLPASVDAAAVSALLSRFHIIGKTAWPAYEQAGHAYRRTAEDGVDIDGLVDEVRLSKKQLQKMIEAYALMVSRKDRKRERFSHYHEFVKSTIVARACADNPGLHDAVLDLIQKGAVPTALEFRAQLPVICKAGPKTLSRLIDGKVGFATAFEEAQNAGGANVSLQKLKRFRTWLALQDVQDAICATGGKAGEELKFEVKRLDSLVRTLHKRMAS